MRIISDNAPTRRKDEQLERAESLSTRSQTWGDQARPAAPLTSALFTAAGKRCLQAGARDEALVARIADLPKLAKESRAAGYKEAAVLSKFAELAKSNSAIS